MYRYTWDFLHNLSKGSDTVDGSEIRRSPVEVGSLSHFLQCFIHPRWCRNFFHQQYVVVLSTNLPVPKKHVATFNSKGGFLSNFFSPAAQMFPMIPPKYSECIRNKKIQ